MEARAQLRELLAAFAFATCVPFGRERAGVLFRGAAHEAAPAELLLRIEALLGLDGVDVLRYADARRGQHRSMRLVDGGAAGERQLQAFLLAGDISAEAWVRPLLQDELPAQAYGRLLLVPGAKAPVAVAARGRQVCSCFDIAETQIVATLQSCSGSADTQLAQLQEQLKCGTNCGSCLPELKRLVRSRQAAA